MRVDVMSFEDVKKALAEDNIHLVDVREPHEYAAGHIPGATNMPLSAFDPQALPTDKPVVLAAHDNKLVFR